MGKPYVVGASSDTTYQALHAAGLLPNDPDTVLRVDIVLEAGSPAKIYVELLADRETVQGVLNLVRPDA